MFVIARNLLEQMIAHARAGWPQEVCGLVGGEGLVGRELVRIPNVASSPRTRYAMNPEALCRTLLDFEDRGLDLVAIYHSHPVGPSEPSETDIAESYYPDTVYVIISLAGAAPEVTAWFIQDDAAEPVDWQVREL